MKRKHAIAGALLTISLGGFVTINRENITNILAPDTTAVRGILITPAQLAALHVDTDSLVARLLPPPPDTTTAHLLREISAHLTTMQQELRARPVPAPQYYIVAVDTVAPADSTQLRWLWKLYRPFPQQVEHP